MYRIIITDDALENLVSISEYIALDNLFYAKKVEVDILKSIKFLESFPLIWKQIELWIYQIINPKYKFKIVYKINGNILLILAIFREQENWH